MKQVFATLRNGAERACTGLGDAAGEGWRAAAPVRAVLTAQAARTRAWPLAWTALYVVVFSVLSILFFDRPVALWLKEHVSGDVLGFFRVVTRLGEAELFLVPAGMLWIGFMVMSLRAAGQEMRRRWRRMSFAPGFLFLSIAVSGLISNAIKISLGRYRPRYLFQEGLYGFSPFNTEWGMNSFPSGHSQAAFAAMTALMVIFPRYDVFWMVIAALVAASRVVTTVHYLSDAVAGAYLAVAVTLLLARAFRARGIDPRIRLPHDHRLAE